MMKTVLFVLALLVAYSIGMSAAMIRKAHAEDRIPHAHRHHHRTPRQNPADSIVFARGEQFHNFLQFCREHPDHCVRVGNTYFIQ